MGCMRPKIVFFGGRACTPHLHMPKSISGGHGTFCCCGLFFLSLLFSCGTPCIVFGNAEKFNQDVSKWNTGELTKMSGSKYTLSPSLWPHLPLLCFWIWQLEFYFQFSHVLYFLFLEWSFGLSFYSLSLFCFCSVKFFTELVNLIQTFQNGTCPK